MKARHTRVSLAYFKFHSFKSVEVRKETKLIVSRLWSTAAFLFFTLPLLSHAQESRSPAQPPLNHNESGQPTHLPRRLYCSFQTVITPFQEAHAQWVQSAENPSQYRLQSIRGDVLFSLSRSADLPWESRVRHDAHRLRLLQRATRSTPLPCETRSSCLPRFREERWEAVAHLSAVATLPGEAPNHWAGTLNASSKSWTRVRSTPQDPLAFLRRPSQRVEQEEVNVSIACRRISE
jgi:hypothetical protein